MTNLQKHQQFFFSILLNCLRDKLKFVILSSPTKNKSKGGKSGDFVGQGISELSQIKKNFFFTFNRTSIKKLCHRLTEDLVLFLP